MTCKYLSHSFSYLSLYCLGPSIQKRFNFDIIWFGYFYLFLVFGYFFILARSKAIKISLCMSFFESIRSVWISEPLQVCLYLWCEARIQAPSSPIGYLVSLTLCAEASLPLHWMALVPLWGTGWWGVWGLPLGSLFWSTGLGICLYASNLRRLWQLCIALKSESKRPSVLFLFFQDCFSN